MRATPDVVAYAAHVDHAPGGSVIDSKPVEPGALFQIVGGRWQLTVSSFECVSVWTVGKTADAATVCVASGSQTASRRSSATRRVSRVLDRDVAASDRELVHPGDLIGRNYIRVAISSRQPRLIEHDDVDASLQLDRECGISATSSMYPPEMIFRCEA